MKRMKTEHTTAEAESLKEYIEEIKQYPLLSTAQEIELAKRVKERNDREAKDLLTLSNLRLVVNLAQRYADKYGNIDVMEIVKAGNAGLISAVRNYDYKAGYKFANYATWWIQQEIARHLGLPKTI